MESTTIYQACSMAFVADAIASSSSSSSQQHQQRRSNFTGLPPRWYTSAGVEKDGEVRLISRVFFPHLRSRPERFVQPSTSRSLSSFSRSPSQNSFAVTLDGKRLHTPARNPLVLPTYPLALAVAAEWASQASRVRPFTMPLMSLAATAIDEPAPRERVVSTMLSYLRTDGALVREGAGTELAKRQAEVFAPVVEWAEGLAKTPFVPSDSVRGAPQSEEAVAAIREHLFSLDKWHLAAASQLAGAAKSVLLALATLDGAVSTEAALLAARLEEDAQASEWGIVEGGHDIDYAGCAVAVSAPAVFARLARVE